MQVFALLLLAVSLTFGLVSPATPLHEQANATVITTTGRDLKAKVVCTPPASAVLKWWYPNHVYYMSTCDYRYDKHGAWTMLNAYRTGGDMDSHWRYVEDDDFNDCLKDWTYYKKDGVTVIAKIEGYATTIGDKTGKPWCALPVYRKGGVLGYQWAYCTCV